VPACCRAAHGRVSRSSCPQPVVLRALGHHPDCRRGPQRHCPRRFPGAASRRRAVDGGLPGQTREGPSGGGPVKGRLQVDGLLVDGLFDDDHGGVNRGDRLGNERPFQGIDRGTPGLGGEWAKRRPVRLLAAADGDVPGIRGRLAARQHHAFGTWGRLRRCPSSSSGNGAACGPPPPANYSPHRSAGVMGLQPILRTTPLCGCKTSTDMDLRCLVHARRARKSAALRRVMRANASSPPIPARGDARNPGRQWCPAVFRESVDQLSGLCVVASRVSIVGMINRPRLLVTVRFRGLLTQVRGGYEGLGIGVLVPGA
jgi:hypothetical protein